MESRTIEELYNINLQPDVWVEGREFLEFLPKFLLNSFISLPSHPLSKDPFPVPFSKLGREMGCV